VIRAVAAFLAALAVTLVATLACERLAPRLGLVKQPRADRWHRRPVPLLGGAAIILGAVPVFAWAGGLRDRLAVLTLASLAMGAVGLLDDLRPLRAPVKLVAQVVLAGVLVQFGFVLQLTRIPVLDIVLTVVWVVGITNAFNLLDNMDGLAAGMAIIAGSFRLAVFVLDGNVAAATMTAGFLGAVAGFLVRNFPPAKIFMGDAGSLFLGFFLGGLSLTVERAYYSRGITGVLAVPVLLMLIPIFDTTFVTLTRLFTGRRISEGGRDHTSHRLVALGIGERRALGLLWGMSVLGGVLALLTYRYGDQAGVILLILALAGLALLGVHLSRVEVVRPESARPDATVVRLAQELVYKRQVAAVLLDCVLVVAAYYGAYLLRFEETFEAHQARLVATLAPVMALQLAGLAASGVYRGVWRYTSLPDLVRIVRGVTWGTVASVVYLVFVTRFRGLSRAVFVLDWLLLIVLLAASRLSFRLLDEVLRGARPGARPVLIYGAGDGGELALRELRNNSDLGREAVGFLDDDRNKVRTRIHGVPVLGGLDGLEDILETQGVQEVVVATRKISGERLRRLRDTCSAHGVAVTRAAVRLE
jgi:UDP-GlcNAc:undecaprenyl-phosphate GlcNAc-1-phosphate transferase